MLSALKEARELVGTSRHAAIGSRMTQLKPSADIDCTLDDDGEDVSHGIAGIPASAWTTYISALASMSEHRRARPSATVLAMASGCMHHDGHGGEPHAAVLDMLKVGIIGARDGH